MSLQKNIKDLIFFYVKTNYNEYLKKQNIKIIDENKIDKSGLHFQVGMQFKLFVLDSFLFYRHTLGDFEDVLDAKSFGSLNFRIGMGF